MAILKENRICQGNLGGALRHSHYDSMQIPKDAQVVYDLSLVVEKCSLALFYALLPRNELKGTRLSMVFSIPTPSIDLLVMCT